jgi:hypothetical protein
MIVYDPQDEGRAGNGEQGLAPPASAHAEEILARRLRATELTAQPVEAGAWWWHGYVGAGKVTLLTSQWKSGKTTLMSILLARMTKAGEIAGLKAVEGRAAIFSEEPKGNWNERCRSLEIGVQHSFFCLPFAGRPTMEQWLGLIEAMLVLRRREHLDLVVIDPLGIFLPGNCENTAARITECLLPLRKLTAAGMGVVLIHHPRKGVNLAGQAARGSGALASFVDILVEMHWYAKADVPDRRRWLRSYSRHAETPRNLIVELTAAGDGYIAHDPADEDAWAGSWQVLCLVLQDATERLTQRQVLEQWPDDFPRPDQGTISRGLKRGVEQGLIRQQGSGRKSDPYRYWLPDKEDEFYPGPGASPEAMERFRIRHRAKMFEAFGMDPKAARAAAALQPSNERVVLACPDPLPPVVVGSSAPAVVAPPAAVVGSPDPSAVVGSPDLTTARTEGLPTPTAHVLAQPGESRPEAADVAATVEAARERESVTGPTQAAQQPSTQPAASAAAAPKAPAEPDTKMPPAQPVSPAPPASASVPGPVALPVDIKIIPTPDPVLSIEEQKRRSRRWPYG